jgi:hypothetical protein
MTSNSSTQAPPTYQQQHASSSNLPTAVRKLLQPTNKESAKRKMLRKQKEYYMPIRRRVVWVWIFAFSVWTQFW